MDTVLTIVVISLFILAPLSMAIAIACDNNIAKVVVIVVTIVCHVTFWVTLGQYGDSETFCFAGLYEIGTIAGVYYIVCDALNFV